MLLRVCCAAAGGSSVLSVHSLHLLYPLEVLAYPFTQETQVSLKIYAHADIIISQDLQVVYYFCKNLLVPYGLQCECATMQNVTPLRSQARRMVAGPKKS